MRQGRRRRPDHDQHPARHGHRHRPDAAAARRASPAGSPGPAIRPVAVRAIWQVRAGDARGPPAGRCRSSASGECAPARDALELVAAGASAVQVGTATFNDPTRPGPGRSASWPSLLRGPGASPASRDAVGVAHDAAGPAPMSGRRRAPFGARLQPRDGRARPAVRRHRPAPAACSAAWGLPDDVAGLETFAMTCVEAFAGTVAAVKPQSAFFEVFGSAGVAVLERALAELREAGTLSLLDVKRGDIGSTMTAYAQAYLGRRQPAAGRRDHGQPLPRLRARCARRSTSPRDTGRGVFVLALTSNPEGAVGAARPARRRQRRGRGRGRRRRRQRGRAAGRSAASGSSSAPRSAPRSSDLGLDLAGGQRPAARARLRRAGRRGRGPARRSSARRCRPCWPAAAARCSAPVPDAAALRRAARRTAGRMAEVTAGR